MKDAVAESARDERPHAAATIVGRLVLERRNDAAIVQVDCDDAAVLNRIVAVVGDPHVNAPVENER